MDIEFVVLDLEKMSFCLRVKGLRQGFFSGLFSVIWGEGVHAQR